MNDDFEKRIESLARGFLRTDPTPAWKAEILERARREADVLSFRAGLPSRWVLWGWAAAWTTILLLGWSERTDSETVAKLAPVSVPYAALLFDLNKGIPSPFIALHPLTPLELEYP
jgi:hypothetical protein